MTDSGTSYIVEAIKAGCLLDAGGIAQVDAVLVCAAWLRRS